MSRLSVLRFKQSENVFDNSATEIHEMVGFVMHWFKKKRSKFLKSRVVTVVSSHLIMSSTLGSLNKPRGKGRSNEAGSCVTKQKQNSRNVSDLESSLDDHSSFNPENRHGLRWLLPIRKIIMIREMNGFRG